MGGRCQEENERIISTVEIWSGNQDVLGSDVCR
jgi:hypothetical protein